MIDFTLNMIPPKHTAQGSSIILKNRKTGRFFIGRKNDSNASLTKKELLYRVIPFRPTKPLESPLKCEIEWVYPWRVSETKKNKEKGFMWCNTRPDCDNITKMMWDVLTQAGFWKDDGLVSKLVFSKKWAKKSYIRIRIQELEDGVDCD